MMYQHERKLEISKAMDVSIESVDLHFALWSAIRDAYDRKDLVGTRMLIDQSQ